MLSVVHFETAGQNCFTGGSEIVTILIFCSFFSGSKLCINSRVIRLKKTEFDKTAISAEHVFVCR